MPTFDTPDPIAVRLEIAAGDVWLTASDRTDTVVEVRPSNPDRRGDVKAAEQTRIDHKPGRVHVKTPRGLSPLGPRGQVDVVIDLPVGSEISCDAAYADIRASGRLGDVAFKTSAGAVRLDEATDLHVATSVGDVTVDRVAGRANVKAGSGQVRIGEIAGDAHVDSASGSTWIGTMAGDLRASAGAGSIAVDVAAASVSARTGYGSVRIGEIRRGSIAAETGYGDIEIGVRQGTAAWLDLQSGGTVRNALDDADAPAATDETAEVRARSGYGGIVITRSPSQPEAARRA
jgi:Putative adhesin